LGKFVKTKNTLLRYVIAVSTVLNGWIYYNAHAQAINSAFNSKMSAIKNFFSLEKDIDATPKVEEIHPKDSLNSSDGLNETLEKIKNLPGVLDSIKAAKKNDDVSIEDYSWLYNRDTSEQRSYIDSLLEVKAAKQKSAQVVDSTKEGELKPEEKEGFIKKWFGKKDKEENPHKRQK
jgi:hypothetical protein